MSQQGTELNCLPAVVEHWVEQRTSGRVHRLQVEFAKDCVIVRGIAGTHYVRQLALAAALEVLQANGGRSIPVELDIRIECRSH